MRVITPEHPLIQDKLTILRDAATPRTEFTRAMRDLGMILGLEVTRDLALQRKDIQTPLEQTDALVLEEPLPVLVPILRAGIGLLEGLQVLLPNAEVGFLGLKRDETTHISATYATRLPASLHDRHCIVLDPMIATGGSLNTALDALFERGANTLSVVSVVASPEGLEALRSAQTHRELTVCVATIDRALNADAYIVPGIGDAGDRLFGETG